MGLDVFPLTPVQEEILFQTLRQPSGAGVYLSHLILRLGEEADERLLVRAGEKVQARHAALRTAFDWSGRGDPVQVVSAGAGLPYLDEDWQDVPEKEREGRLREFLIADRSKGFDPGKQPLFRLTLIRFGPTDLRLILTFHQIILDHHSAAQVLREILECCRALGRGEEWSPPPAPDFGGFADWLRGRRSAKNESFWQEYLRGFTAPTPMPPPLVQEQTPGREKRKEPGDTITGARERRVLDRAATENLNRLAQDLGLSLQILLTGAWALLLSRHSGQGEVLFAVIESILGLAPPEFRGVGNHLGAVPLRVRLDPEARLGQWLAGLARDYDTLYRNQGASLSQIRALSSLPGEEPLFETYLSFGSQVPETAFGLGENQGAGPKAAWETRTPLPLLLAAYSGEELVLEFEYDRRRYSQEASSRIIEQVETLLRAMIRNPESRIKDLSGLTASEARRLFLEWQPPPPPELAETRIHHLFQQAAARDPEALAVRHEEERITYGQFEEKANRWAHYLRSLGVGPESLVGLALGRSIDQIVLMIAILKAGGAYLPLDPEYPLDRLNYMIQDSGASLVVASSQTKNLEGFKADRVVLLEEAAGQVRQMPPDPPPCRVSGDNLAYVIYTSGSTGRPKGVMVEHRSLAHYILNSCSILGIGPKDRCLQFTSISFDMAVEEIFASLLNGAALILRNKEMAASVKDFCRVCQEWSLTVLDLPTSYWHLLAEELKPGGLPQQVRLVVIGGEEARPDKLTLWQSKVSKEVALCNSYGPTEATICVSIRDLAQESAAGKHLSIGRPVKSARAYVLDRDLVAVPQGATGELFVSGPQLARGYLGRPELTEERFPTLNPVPPEFRGTDLDPGEIRLYRTGDRVCFRSDGQLLYLGRYDRQVQIRGYRVELGEVEAVLSGHPGVRMALAHVREDGLGEKNLLGYIQPREGQGEDRLRDELRELMAAGLPAYMRPSALIFMDHVPLTSNGKINYEALPGLESVRAGDGKPGSENRVEADLIALWEEVLGVKGIKPGDNFFDLGGNSLLAIRLTSLIENTMGRSIHALRLFQSPTVSGLARFLEQEEQEEQEAPPGCLETFQEKGEKPPLFFIGSSSLAPNLIPYIGQSQPFYGFNLLGLQGQGGASSFRPVEDIAGQLIREIKRVRPSGPYRLAGYCADGELAREMALQLLASGDKVDFLAYVDAFWGKDASFLGLKRHLANLKKFGRPYLRSKIRSKKRTFAAKARNNLSRLERFIRAKSGLEIPPRLETELLLNQLLKSLIEYRSQPYPGVITFILAEEWGGNLSEKGIWVSGGGHVLKVVPGFHDNLFEEPQAAHLGRALRECLEDLDG